MSTTHWQQNQIYQRHIRTQKLIQQAAKANQATTYKNTDVESSLSAKADQATTYAKIEVDSTWSGKMHTNAQ